MPTILRAGPYRFFFYSNESQEPAHIHVGKGGEAKFWLLKCELAASYGFKPQELTTLLGIVIDNRGNFPEAWHERFSGKI